MLEWVSNRSAWPAALRRTRGALVAAWLLCASLALALAARDLEVPGLYYDEAFQAGPALDFVRGEARAHAPGIESVPLAGRPFPWLTQAYMGALKSQLLIPSFVAFGADKRVLRVTTLAWAVLGMGLAMALMWQLAGLAPAVLSGLLLATDPSLLLVARHDWGSATLAFGLRCGTLVCALAGWRGRQRRRWWLAAGLLAGLGVYNKVDFASALAAFALALLAVAARPVFQALRRERLAVAAAVLGLLVAAAPLGPSLRTVWRASRAFGAASAAHAGDLAEKWRVLCSTLDGSYFERLMRTGGDFARLGQVREAGSDGLGAAAAVCALGLALWASRALRRPPRGDAPARGAAFLLLAAALVLVAILATPHAVRIHHFLALAPLPHAIVGLAATLAWRGVGGLGGATRRLARATLAVLLLALVLAGARETGRTLAFLRASGGRGLWSDAIDRFAARLDGDSTRDVVALDWGLAEPLRFLTRGPRIEEPIYGFRVTDAGGAAWRHAGTSGSVYVVWQAPYAVFGHQAKFLRALTRLPADAVELVPWRDRGGETVFLAARVLRPHVVTYFGDFSIRLLPESAAVPR